MDRRLAPAVSPTSGRQVTRIWFPPPSEDCSAVTAERVIAAASEEWIALVRPEPGSAWLIDDRGRRVFWHLSGDQLVLTTFPTPNPRETTHGLGCTICDAEKSLPIFRG